MTIAELAEKYDVYVITDEVYEHIVYAPYQHVYCSPSRHEKTYNFLQLCQRRTDHRLASRLYDCAAEITDRIRKVHDLTVGGGASPEAVIPGLQFNRVTMMNCSLFIHTQARSFLNGLDKIGLKHNIPQGVYYIMVDISEFGYDDLKFCEDLAGKSRCRSGIQLSMKLKPLYPVPFCQKETLQAAL